MEETTGDTVAPFPDRVGDRLRAARTAAGLALSDIAERTRVPLRHLEAIEKSDFSAFPSDTYAMGFVRAYVRAVGADETRLMHDLRMELGRDPAVSMMSAHEDIADPARIPPRSLAAVATLIIVLMALGYTIWQSAQSTDPTATAPAQTAAPAATAETKKPAPAAAAGAVTLFARGEVWLRISDADQKVIFEGILQKDSSFTVPADAREPVVQSAMASLIDVAIGTAPARSLTNGKQVIKNWPISAAALQSQAKAADEAPQQARPKASEKPSDAPRPKQDEAPEKPAGQP